LLAACAAVLSLGVRVATPANAVTLANAETPESVATPDNVAIDRALAPLRSDADLGGMHKGRSLRWVTTDAPRPDSAAAPWLVSLFERISQGASLLIWVAGTIAAGFTGVWLYRYVRERTQRRIAAEDPLGPRAQQSELDLRPVSLPQDIGAAARELLEAGQLRDALSLLYRGALSRAVHRFGVPIGAAATEGEALRAVEARLDPLRSRYFGELVQLWRRVVYAGDAGEMPAATADGIRRLCANFDEALGGAPP
jgi:hypothetical protein